MTTRTVGPQNPRLIKGTSSNFEITDLGGDTFRVAWDLTPGSPFSATRCEMVVPRHILSDKDGEPNFVAFNYRAVQELLVELQDDPTTWRNAVVAAMP